MRWYHYIGAFMVMIPWFGLGVLPEGFLHWYTLIPVLLCAPVGILIMKYAPIRPEPYWTQKNEPKDS